MRYKERLKAVMDNKQLFTYQEVSNRLKALGITWGSGKKLVEKVLRDQTHENEDVLKAAEDVLRTKEMLNSGAEIPAVD